MKSSACSAPRKWTAMPDRKLEPYFRARKCAMPDVGLLQPADPILNAAGEDIRRRIFMSADREGHPMCLRPEFTIPVCLVHLESGKEKQRYGYAGKVFRQRVDEPDEFLQAGIEDIGAKNTIAADARCLKEAVELVRELGGKKLAITIGDQAIFEAVLKALGLPSAWRERLGRNFGDADRIKADLDRLSGENGDGLSDLSPKLLEAVEAGDKEAVETLIADMMSEAGLSESAGRTPGEIAKRLLGKAKLASVRLDPARRDVLEAFLNLDLPLSSANRRLWSFVRKFHIPLGDALEDFHKRSQAIMKLELENVSIRYQAGFGRTIDYYTGFVFELRASGKPNAKPLAGGGRYDKLLTLLGSKREIPATGFAVYVDRVTAKPKKSAKKAETKTASKPAAKKAGVKK